MHSNVISHLALGKIDKQKIHICVQYNRHHTNYSIQFVLEEQTTHDADNWKKIAQYRKY